MKNFPRIEIVCLVLTCLILAEAGQVAAADQKSDALLQKIGFKKGICVFLGLPDDGKQNAIVKLAKNSDLLVYVQCSEQKDVRTVREAAETAGFLGRQIWAERGLYTRIHLADNLADAVLVSKEAVKGTNRDEVLRVQHPEAKGFLGDEVLSKPFPEGVDDWTHPQHGPDNNMLSMDRVVKAPYRTQFMADPKFGATPAVTVTAAGRVFRAHGNGSRKGNQTRQTINSLLAINGYNGTILWTHPLKEGFLVHRNAMAATKDRLYLADNASCKLLDARTGKLLSEIIVPQGVSDRPVWKWIALEGGMLYALVGGPDLPASMKKRKPSGLKGWSRVLAFGQTIAAFDPATKKMLWHHRAEETIDCRSMCMKNGRIYFYSPGNFLGCLNAKDGKVLWKSSAPELLAAIGKRDYGKGWLSFNRTTYAKCTEGHVLFSGSKLAGLVMVSAKDGRMLWQKKRGGSLILREDGFYTPSIKLSYKTGKKIGGVTFYKFVCASVTGTLDSMFARGNPGTACVDLATGKRYSFCPMRPPCRDGVIPANGMLYWGPWDCKCRMCLVGHIGLAPSGNAGQQPVAETRLQKGPAYDSIRNPKSAIRNGNDWPGYRGNNERTARTKVAIPASVKQVWTFKPASPYLPTAPVAVGGLVFVGDASGTVRALDVENGTERWKAYTGGRIVFPPATWNCRVYAGSDDGYVYALEAVSGRLLWRFQAASNERKINVYGRLTSTWPVAGGIVVEDGVVYAAAGIADYDGTHVYALDGLTGKVKWHNGDSGRLSEKKQTGISLQGHLYCSDGELCFAGGNVHETARYDLKTGKCLNDPNHRSGASSCFEAYYPFYNRHAPIRVVLSDGNVFRYSANPWTFPRIRSQGPGLHKPLSPDALEKIKSKKVPRNKKPKPEMIWDKKWMCRSFIVGPEVFVAAGTSEFAPKDSYDLCAAKIRDGSKVWSQVLPAKPVRWGTAMDGKGRIFVSLDDGQVLCFARKQ